MKTLIHAHLTRASTEVAVVLQELITHVHVRQIILDLFARFVIF